ncbi:efflux RND transporter periplasmic adaptor subunit [Pedobacter sp. SYSU D00535]|uniref:efflux RND transporter periplasmic adaptor subunit n=1 Tax=Pedobacter sp. SYSU D00535 TaxID=2810308 RepID=UPI001A974ED4|nr:efflux RND transporter periplasmic adaptor subunit [Pedobacter sp. SYSU D00535]
MSRQLKGKILIGFFSLLMLLFAACNRGGNSDKETAHATSYTCPMHPQVVTKEPGTCPICHMDLVPTHRHEGEDRVQADLNRLIKPTNQLVLADVRTVKPQEGVRFAELSLQGVINYNTNNWRAVSSRVGGRIEKLYVEYSYQPVTKGQKLMEIYSPDLANAQQELLYVSRAGDRKLLDAAKRKLLLLGATAQQINQVLKTGKVDYSVTIYSPYSGYLTEPSAGAASPTVYAPGSTAIAAEGAEMGGGMSSMGGGASSSTPSVPKVTSNAPLQLREGQYVSAGETLFQLINAADVWAEFFAGPEQLRFLKKGSLVQLTSVDDPRLKTAARVTLLQPYYSEGNSFSLLRAKVGNTARQWKVGQLISVKTELDRKFGTWIPRTSVLSLGTRNVVFVKQGAAFVPRYVELVERRGNWVDVGSGLSKDTELAVNAWFLVDSESLVDVDSLSQ